MQEIRNTDDMYLLLNTYCWENFEVGMTCVLLVWPQAWCCYTHECFPLLPVIAVAMGVCVIAVTAPVFTNNLSKEDCKSCIVKQCHSMAICDLICKNLT